jgi:iron complex outermembrane receptor protein
LSDVIIIAGLRKEFYEGLNPRMQYSFGLRYKPNEHLVLRSGFSSKFRKPTFNEKHWRPGGNPLLQPEKGRGGEVTAEWSSNRNQKHAFWFDARATGYYQWIDNWIQWVIHDSLTPVEYKKVHARGLDTWFEYGYTSTTIALRGLVNYNFNRSVIVNTYDHNIFYEGNQLMYAPIHSIRAGFEANYRGFALGFSSAYTGYRETVETADKSLRLPGYCVYNLITGFHKEIMNLDLALYFQVDNLFDKSYEVIRSYPLPGRTYHFNISIGLEKAGSED